MPWLGTITAVGLVALAGLTWLLLKFRSQDVLDAIAAKRRGSSTLVTMGCYVEGLEKMPVVLALTTDAFYYENADLQASLELDRIEEVEYDDETMTGHAVEHGRALRIRSHGRCFEFILKYADATKWEAALPPHQDQRHARAV